MKKPSATYRFFCTLTAFTLLVSVSMPAGLHAEDLADFCNMEAMEHDAMPMPEADHSDWAASTDTPTDAENCPLGFICCSIGTTAVKANAVPSPSKIFAGYIPVLVQILDITPDPEYVKASKQVLVSLYSPPIFLLNSSFLN